MSHKRLYFAADDKLLGALVDVLRRSGLVVDTFGTQAELVSRVKVDPPDVVLLGAKLIDGTALGAFRALAPKAPPTFVILGAGQQAFRAGLLRAGVSDVVVAPVRPRQLAGRLIELAGGQRRAENRERTEVPVEIDLDGRSIRGTTTDVSREGIGLSLSGAVPEDEAVPILVKPPSGAALKVFGRLVHSRADGERILAGFRLLGTTSEEESVLLQIASAYPSADVPLIIERRLPESAFAPREEPVAESERPTPPMPPPAVKAEHGEPTSVRWPESSPSLLQSLEHLRFAALLLKTLGQPKRQGDQLPAEWTAGRSELEVAAIRFALGLTSLERQSFEPDPEIVILADDMSATVDAEVPVSLDPELATILCIGAAHRFRALCFERRGRTVFESSASRRAGADFEVARDVLREVLDGLRQWSVDVQTLVHDAQVTRDKDLSKTLLSLQDLAAKQAAAIRDVVALADGASEAQRGSGAGAPRVAS